MKHLILGVSAALLLSACATTQLTSGADDNARGSIFSGIGGLTGSSVDQDVRDIAAIEPGLRFPARIGVAFVDKGRLTTLPLEHIDAWQPVFDRVQPDYGEIVPISPLITSMVAKVDPKTNTPVIDNIRRGAARQHVDYVLVYELTALDKRKSNALRLTDLSVLGLFVLPSREVEVKATASAVLLDVRSGYPYGTAGGLATKDSLTTYAGQNSATSRLGSKAEAAAMEALAKDVETMFDQLIAKTIRQVSAQ